MKLRDAISGRAWRGIFGERRNEIKKTTKRNVEIKRKICRLGKNKIFTLFIRCLRVP